MPVRADAQTQVMQPAPGRAVQFFSAFQDIPLMPGLVEMSDQVVAYDKPGGRIVETLADTGTLGQEDISAYYKSALPQFGWQGAGPNRFVRENEVLTLNFESLESRLVIRLVIEPL